MLVDPQNSPVSLRRNERLMMTTKKTSKKRTIRRQVPPVVRQVRRFVFPRGLPAQIRAYAIGMVTARQTAEKFKDFGLTREIVYAFADGVAEIREDDVSCIVEE